MWTDYVYCQKLQGEWNKHMLHVLNSMFGDEWFKQYVCSEPDMFSDLVCCEACQYHSKQDIRNGSTTRH